MESRGKLEANLGSLELRHRCGFMTLTLQRQVDGGCAQSSRLPWVKSRTIPHMALKF